MSFVCPKCGSSHFGSSSDSDGNLTTGMCHDEFGFGCKYKWDRSDPIEDGRHFPSTFIHPDWPVIEQWTIDDTFNDSGFYGVIKLTPTVAEKSVLTGAISQIQVVNGELVATNLSNEKWVLGEHADKDFNYQLKTLLGLIEKN